MTRAACTAWAVTSHCWFILQLHPSALNILKTAAEIMKSYLTAGLQTQIGPDLVFWFVVQDVSAVCADMIWYIWTFQQVQTHLHRLCTDSTPLIAVGRFDRCSFDNPMFSKQANCWADVDKVHNSKCSYPLSNITPIMSKHCLVLFILELKSLSICLKKLKNSKVIFKIFFNCFVYSCSKGNLYWIYFECSWVEVIRLKKIK